MASSYDNLFKDFKKITFQNLFFLFQNINGLVSILTQKQNEPRCIHVVFDLITILNHCKPTEARDISFNNVIDVWIFSKMTQECVIMLSKDVTVQNVTVMSHCFKICWIVQRGDNATKCNPDWPKINSCNTQSLRVKCYNVQQNQHQQHNSNINNIKNN